MTDVEATLPAPQDRGRLVIRDAVVETVARRAAASVSTSHRASGLDRLVGRDLPEVRMDVQGAHVHADVTVAALWPTPVGNVAEKVRAAVVRDVSAYTGLTVTRVQVHVRCVAPEPADVRRVR